MIGKLKLKLISAIFVILFLQAAAIAYCQSGNGQGGQNGQKPFNLVAVTLAGGGNVQNAADIPTEPQFVVEFDKNVVNSLIWENNSKCFSLISQDNENIPVSVTKGDDAIESNRQSIFVQPVNPLRPGTSYYLNISPELKAKNGATLGGTNGQGVSIAFKTKGEAAVKPPQTTGTTAAPADAGTPSDPSGKDNQVLEKNQVQQQVAASSPAASEKTAPDLAKTPEETTGSLAGWTTTAGGFLVAGWIVFEILTKRKKMI